MLPPLALQLFAIVATRAAPGRFYRPLLGPLQFVHPAIADRITNHGLDLLLLQLLQLTDCVIPFVGSRCLHRHLISVLVPSRIDVLLRFQNRSGYLLPDLPAAPRLPRWLPCPNPPRFA